MFHVLMILRSTIKGIVGGIVVGILLAVAFKFLTSDISGVGVPLVAFGIWIGAFIGFAVGVFKQAAIATAERNKNRS